MPKEMFDFKSNGVTLKGGHYLAENPTSTIICLTGDGTSGSQSSTWPSLISTLNSQGHDVIIFDFESQGLSEGTRDRLNLLTGKQSFLDFLAFADQNYIFRTKEICCLGSSFGAAVLLHSPETFQRFSKISLKSPAFELAQAYETEIGGIDRLGAWRDEGIHSKLGLSFQAYIEALSANSYRNLLRISSPTLITVGDEDEIVGVTGSVRARSIRPDVVRLEILQGVLHNYKQEGAKEKFEALNCAFFGERS